MLRAEVVKFGCGGRTRTSDHRINNPALYQLSYTTPIGRKLRAKPRIVADDGDRVNPPEAETLTPQTRFTTLANFPPMGDVAKW